MASWADRKGNRSSVLPSEDGGRKCQTLPSGLLTKAILRLEAYIR